MFHIVFNVNEEYVKYLAVLCHSIIKSTPKDSPLRSGGGGANNPLENNPLKEGYCFHILTDGMSEEMARKLEALEAELGKEWACRFCVHVCEDSDFWGLPKLNGNYLTYLRLKLARYLPQEVERCLYMDADMLCVGDLREIFGMDMEGRICAAVRDAHYQDARIMPARADKNSSEASERASGEANKNACVGANDGKKLAAQAGRVASQEQGRDSAGFSLNLEFYFNAGLMLIDVAAWRREGVEQKCFEFLSHYVPQWHDQDTLNATLAPRVKLLPLEWNYMIGHLEQSKRWLWGWRGVGNLAYSKRDYLRAKKKLKILHFIRPRKPWHEGVGAAELANQSYEAWVYLKRWWEVALGTPIFGEELRAIYEVNCQSIRGAKKASYLKRAWQRYLHLLYAL